MDTFKDTDIYFIKCKGKCNQTKPHDSFHLGTSVCKDCCVAPCPDKKKKLFGKKSKMSVTHEFFCKPEKKRRTIVHNPPLPINFDRRQYYIDMSQKVNEWDRHRNRVSLMECKSHAGERGLKWGIDDFVAVAMINTPCVLSGLTGHNWIGMIGRSLTYTEGNAVPCDTIVYSMLGNMMNGNFVHLCKRIVADNMDPLSAKMAMSMASRFDKCSRDNKTFLYTFKDVCKIVSEYNLIDYCKRE